MRAYTAISFSKKCKLNGFFSSPLFDAMSAMHMCDVVLKLTCTQPNCGAVVQLSCFDDHQSRHICVPLHRTRSFFFCFFFVLANFPFFTHSFIHSNKFSIIFIQKKKLSFIQFSPYGQLEKCLEKLKKYNRKFPFFPHVPCHQKNSNKNVHTYNNRKTAK